MNLDREARDLERRLGRAYLSVFAAVLIIFGIAVHVAVWYDIEAQQRTTLSTLLARGQTAFEMRGGVRQIDTDGPNLGDPRGEGVAWYDGAGKRLASEGFVPALSGVPMAAGSGGVSHDLRWATAATPTGFVRAFTSRVRDTATLARADLALVFGFAIALAASAAGGRLLAARAIVPTVRSMRLLRDFTADAAHELRGPLAALRSNAAASLRADTALPDDHRTRLQTIDATARAMSRTVDDLLLLARSGRSLERELFAIDLTALTRDVATARVSQAADRGVRLVVAEAPPLRMYGDPAEIERIAGNLIDNAIRHSPAGGETRVRCTAERGGVALEVVDSGPGIPAEDHDRIFERFWRGDRARTRDSGSGLGLAIVKALVARHGGNVSLSSALGHGSLFSVWFPARPPERGVAESGYEADSTLSQP